MNLTMQCEPAPQVNPADQNWQGVPRGRWKVSLIGSYGRSITFPYFTTDGHEPTLQSVMSTVLTDAVNVSNFGWSWDWAAFREEYPLLTDETTSAALNKMTENTENLLAFLGDSWDDVCDTYLEDEDA